jgi:hypothetical protein
LVVIRRCTINWVYYLGSQGKAARAVETAVETAVDLAVDLAVVDLAAVDLVAQPRYIFHPVIRELTIQELM